MEHIALMCPILLVTMLARPSVLAHVQINDQARLGRTSIIGYEHIHGPLYLLLGRPPTSVSGPSVLSSLGDPHQTPSHSNPSSDSFHNIAPMQVRRLSTLHRLNSATSSWSDRSAAAEVPGHAYFHLNTGTDVRLASGRQPQSSAQLVVVQFTEDPSAGITGSAHKSGHHGCRLGSKKASGTDGFEVKHTRSHPRVKRRKTRGTEHAWGDDLDSVLSKLGQSSSDSIIYNNINTLLGQLTGSHPRLVRLSRDMYNVQGPTSPTDASHKVAVQAAPQDNRFDQDRESQPNISDPIDETEQGFSPPSDQGSYYYDVWDDMSADIHKRGKSYKENIYALIKHGPRHTQTLPLQDLPRASSSLRTYDTVDRSPNKEQTLRPSMLSPKGTVCEAESDGVMPMRCPSSPDTCLYDAMICDGRPNCPQAEDESFPLCVLRHWTLRWFRKFLPATQRQASP